MFRFAANRTDDVAAIDDGESGLYGRSVEKFLQGSAGQQVDGKAAMVSCLQSSN
jgi:hypothetical protein